MDGIKKHFGYVNNMINLLFLIPAFILGYVVCYFIMTHGVDQ
jgi:hypothetical protein